MQPAGFEVIVAADTLHAMNINFLDRSVVACGSWKNQAAG